MTAGGGIFIGSEVSRNKRSAQCVAFSRLLPVADEGRGNVNKPIEAAEGSHPARRILEKRLQKQAPNVRGAGGIRTHGTLPYT